jgi:hypothetical protein
VRARFRQRLVSADVVEMPVRVDEHRDRTAAADLSGGFLGHICEAAIDREDAIAPSKDADVASESADPAELVA